MQEFLPVARMMERARLARAESDTAYFMELLYLGELTLKVLVVELLAGLQEDRDRHRYAIESRLVRADGVGEWATALDELLTGPASQHFVASSRQSQQALATADGPADDSWRRRAVDQLNQACRCLDDTVEDLSRTKVSYRHWARQFVWLRNRTRGHGAPRVGTLATISPALQASFGEVVSAAPAFARSWAYLRRSLSGKYRVSGFGGDRDDFAYLTRDDDHSLADGVYAFLDSPRQASLLFSDSDLTDFWFPNGNFRNGRFEVLSYITDDRRTEGGAQYALPPAARPPSETASRPSMDVVGNVFSNMPPPRSGYIYRPTLEERLRDVLCDDRFPVVTLQGRGGVGKTSAALAVLHQIARRDDFFALLWFSARDIDLLPEGPRVVKPDLLSVDDLARDFAALMHSTGSTPKLAEAKDYLTASLSGRAKDGPFVFVIDNFETVRDQNELFSYLNNAVRLPNKVLITTRTRDFKADFPIEVRGMSWDEYRRLVEQTARRLEITHLVDSQYEQQLYEESDGHPYITKVLLGEVAKERRRLSPKRVVATQDAMLDALFDRSYAALSPAARRTFLVLSSWRSVVPRVGLEAVLLRPGNERLDVERAIAELEQSSLIEEVHEPDGHAFLSVPLAAALFGARKLVTSPLKIAVDADIEVLREFGAMSASDVARGLGPRIDRLVRSAARRAEVGGHVPELPVIEYIATEYPPAWSSLAELHQELGDIPSAISSLSRYLESCPRDGAAWSRLAVLYRRSGDAVGEIHARLQSAELTAPAFHELSSTASRLNGLLSRREIQLDADERRLIVRKVRSLMEARRSEADATDMSRLAWLCMHDQDADAGEKWANAGLALDPTNEHCRRLQQRIAESRSTA